MLLFSFIFAFVLAPNLIGDCVIFLRHMPVLFVISPTQITGHRMARPFRLPRLTGRWKMMMVVVVVVVVVAFNWALEDDDDGCGGSGGGGDATDDGVSGGGGGGR